jgi:hypothetical protein
MGAFLQWVATRYEEVHAKFDMRLAEFRKAAGRCTVHARTPEIVANLQAGFELYLEFCVARGVVDQLERNHVSSRCWEALQEAALAQANEQKANEPTERYLTQLGALLTAGRAHLEARQGGAPVGSERSCGWRPDRLANWSPSGDCIGWVDGDDLYLEPHVAYRLVQAAGRDSREVLPVTEHRLRQLLKTNRLLVSVDSKRQTLTVRKLILGSSRPVLHLSRNSLLPKAADDLEIEDQGNG